MIVFISFTLPYTIHSTEFSGKSKITTPRRKMARHQRESNGHGQTLRQKSTSHNSSQLRRFHERVSNPERKLSQSW